MRLYKRTYLVLQLLASPLTSYELSTHNSWPSWKTSRRRLKSVGESLDLKRIELKGDYDYVEK